MKLTNKQISFFYIILTNIINYSNKVIKFFKIKIKYTNYGVDEMIQNDILINNNNIYKNN